MSNVSSELYFELMKSNDQLFKKILKNIFHMPERTFHYKDKVHSNFVITILFSETWRKCLFHFEPFLSGMYLQIKYSTKPMYEASLCENEEMLSKLYIGGISSRIYIACGLDIDEYSRCLERLFEKTERYLNKRKEVNKNG